MQQSNQNYVYKYGKMWYNDSCNLFKRGIFMGRKVTSKNSDGNIGEFNAVRKDPKEFENDITGLLKTIDYKNALVVCINTTVRNELEGYFNTI